MKPLIVPSTKLAEVTEELCLHAAHIYYLNDDYLNLQALRAQTELPLRTLGPLFHEKAAEIEPYFVEAIENLYQDNVAWIGSHLASKSATSSSLFRHIVYLACAVSLVAESLKKAEAVAFVVDDASLANAILQNTAKRCDPKFATYYENIQQKETRQHCLRLWAKVAVFFFAKTWLVLRYGCFASTKSKRHGIPEVVLRSWVTRGCFGTDGSYEERNFGALLKWYQEQKKRIAIYPMLFNMGESYQRTITRMQKTDANFIIPEEHLSVRDVWQACTLSLQQFRWPILRTLLKDQLDITSLIQASVKKLAGNIDLANHNLIYFVFKNWGHKQNISATAPSRKLPEQIVYPFENNALEKTLLYAARKYLPHTELIGYQHSMWYRGQPSMRLAEHNKLPLPDRIVTSGDAYIEVLRKCGFPASILHQGPSLRFDFSGLKPDQGHPKKNSFSVKVLIILNNETSHGVELLLNWQSVVGQFPQVQTEIKSHPLNHMDSIRFAAKEIPGHQFVEGNVGALIDSSDIVVVQGASVTMLEAMIRAKPTIRVLPSSSIYLDPLWTEYPLKNVSSQDELGKTLELAIMLVKEKEKQDALYQTAELIRTKYFAAVSSEKMQIFRSEAKPTNAQNA